LLLFGRWRAAAVAARGAMMQWLFPAAGILICLGGMCLVMGAISFLGRRRRRRADERMSPRSDTTH
jgi:hypothetical protein